mgnify:CR=1 FL=1
MIRPQSAWVVNFFGLSHGSLSDYIGTTSGVFTPCDETNGSPFDCHRNVDNLFWQLQRQGRSDWRQWMQSMPEPCRRGVYLGVAEHRKLLQRQPQPRRVLRQHRGDYSHPSAYCQERVIPAGTLEPENWSVFEQALDTGQVRGFKSDHPEQLVENGHSVCVDDKNGGFSRPKSVDQWDDYLSRAVPRIMNSPAFGRNGVLVIVFDEGYGSKMQSGGRVMFAVLGQRVVPGTYGTKPTGSSGNPNLYSLLQMLEDGYRLPRLGFAGSAVRWRISGNNAVALASPDVEFRTAALNTPPATRFIDCGLRDRRRGRLRSVRPFVHLCRPR